MQFHEMYKKNVILRDLATFAGQLVKWIHMPDYQIS